VQMSAAEGRGMWGMPEQVPARQPALTDCVLCVHVFGAGWRRSCSRLCLGPCQASTARRQRTGSLRRWEEKMCCCLSRYCWVTH
jgi:hypothetical protein